ERYLPKLAGKALGAGSGVAERVRALDVAFQLVAPSLLFTAVALVLVSLTASILGAVLPDPFRRAAFAIPPAWALALGALSYLIPAVGIARFRPPAAIWGYYLLQSAYLALSAPLAVTGWLRRSGRVWWRTPKG